MPSQESVRLRAKYRKDNNLDINRVILGDENGVVYDKKNPNSGMVYVRTKASDGWSTGKLVRGPVGSNVPLRSGLGVYLDRDQDDELYVSGVRFASLRDTGVNPLAGNSNDPNAGNYVGQQSILTALAYSIGGTKVGIKGWQPIYLGTKYTFDPVTIDFASPLIIPTAGNGCLALISILEDFSGVEVTVSTTKPSRDIFGDADVQECLDSISTNSTPDSVWYLHDTDQAESFLDVRQLINLGSSGSGITEPIATLQEYIWIGCV